MGNCATIKNCHITGFANGVATNVKNFTILDSTISNNLFTGVQVDDASDLLLRHGVMEKVLTIGHRLSGLFTFSWLNLRIKNSLFFNNSAAVKIDGLRADTD
jgi:hypothetical protein